MSMTFAPLPRTDENLYFQGAWSRMFGRFIQIARCHRISTATVRRVLKDPVQAPAPVQSQPYTGVTQGVQKPAA